METDPQYPYGVPASGAAAPSGALSPALERATTWAAADLEQARRQGARLEHSPFYPRYGHPNGRRFEARVAKLEGTDGAVSFASGMAAIHAVFGALCGQGDRVLVAEQVYGGTDALSRLDLPRFGVTVERFDAQDPASLDGVLQQPAVLCWVENPVNPTLRILDLPALGARCREAGVVLACDATFAPPPLQRVTAMGCDLAVHSATKALGGHSDVLAGVVAGSHRLLGLIEAFRTRSGGMLAPDAAWLLERSLGTLELRLAAQTAAAAELARAMAADAGPGRPVRRVLHPGLAEHPDHHLAVRLLPLGTGNVFSFEVAGGLEGARRVYDRLQRAARAPSLGGIETLVSLPRLSSHAAMSDEQRARCGVNDGLLRISVGLEPVDELLADLRRAICSD